MLTPLRVLLLEDRPADAELMLHELRRAGFAPVWQRVESEEEYLGRLDAALDVILADYTLPQFDAPRALQRLQQRGLDIPFIVVTGAISEEAAVECMKQGAADYLLKDRLGRLGQAVRRALGEKRVRDEKRQAEAELRESEARYRAVSELTSDYAYAFAVLPNGAPVCEWVTEAFTRITGFTLDEVAIEGGWASLVHPDDRLMAARRWESLLAGRADVGEFRIVTKRGEIRLLRDHGRPVWDEAQGRVIRIYGAAQDITERRAAERLKDEFISTVSHELRTPLNSIIGFSELLLDDAADVPAAQRHRFIGNIHQSGQHLLNLVNDILDLTKIEAGRMELHPVPFEVAASLRAVEGTLLPLAEKKRLTLVTRVAPEVTILYADDGKFKQVLYNLLSNAVKFTPEGGRVETTARLRDGAVEVVVADTGIGIAPEDQERIFERFQQIDSSAARRHQGTGLGLALTRRLVELQGGRIWVESAPGKGSRFGFTVPLRAAAARCRERGGAES